jgi:peroxiredoxin Q/BCP
VIGISTDTLADQEDFTKKETLNFPLYADADKKAAKEYGVLAPNGFASRSTFVIDKKGILRKIYPTAQAAKHPDEVLQFVKENLERK